MKETDLPPEDVVYGDTLAADLKWASRHPDIKWVADIKVDGAEMIIAEVSDGKTSVSVPLEMPWDDDVKNGFVSGDFSTNGYRHFLFCLGQGIDDETALRNSVRMKGNKERGMYQVSIMDKGKIVYSEELPMRDVTIRDIVEEAVAEAVSKERAKIADDLDKTSFFVNGSLYPIHPNDRKVIGEWILSRKDN